MRVGEYQIAGNFIHPCIFHFAPFDKNMKYWLAGEKIWFIKKEKNIRWKMWKNGEEKRKFSLQLGGKISSLKKGGVVGQKYPIFEQIYTPAAAASAA